MSLINGIKLITFLCITSLVGCAESQQDFCKYLTLEEAQSYDTTIAKAEMRQTERILYCVYGDGISDKLFISLDRALNYPVEDFLKVLAKNSPEENEEIITLPDTGSNAAALFLGDDGKLELDFLIAQNSQYSVTIRAPEIGSTEADKIHRLKDIAARVLSRL